MPHFRLGRHGCQRSATTAKFFGRGKDQAEMNENEILLVNNSVDEKKDFDEHHSRAAR